MNKTTRAVPVAVAAIALSAASPPALNIVERVPGGVVVRPTASDASRVTVTLHGDGQFHVVAQPSAALNLPRSPSLMAPNPPGASANARISETATSVTIAGPRGSAIIDRATGALRFLDAGGKEYLATARSASFRPTSADGQRYWAVSQQFNRGSDEGFYGLGQHQNAQMDYRCQDVELAQHNMDIAVPFVVSTRGYGLLWDNNSISRFGNPQPYKLVGEGMRVTSNGTPGFTATYYLAGKPVVTRQEATIDYQYLDDQAKWPEAAKATTTAAAGGQNPQGNAVEPQKVVWTGLLHPDSTGRHKFQLYGSSYYKVWIGGKLVLDRWRQNWNPWYANFDTAMTRGRPVPVRIEWLPNSGYMALLHNAPLPAADCNSLWMTSDVARAIDYWVIPGGSIDGAIAGYRQITGKSAMLPKWAYGFWQSRQRYDTQKEVVDTVATYRRLGIPLDNIVLDWRYWRDDDWGSHRFDPTRFANPDKMIDDVHAMNARFMISVWPKFYPTTDTYKELAAKGLVYQGNIRQQNKDWVGPGYLSTFYDPYAPEGRKIFWDQIEKRLAKKGVDAWWADASEPDMHSNLSIEKRLDTMGPTAAGPAAEFFNSYALMNARSFADGWKSFKPDVRPFLLTRSGFAGLQRESAAIWSGDVASRWFDLRAQISAGVNASMSGIPNWTHDIGGFALEDRFSTKTPKPQDLDEWRELNLRWFQFGAFSPLFRSHGEAPFREIYEISPEGSPMRASMVWYDHLRYRLMPYIYTLAADTFQNDGSIMRALAADFPNDRAVRGIDDEYLFGRAFLVAPVTDYRARSRKVTFPAGTDWIDFATGRVFSGGTSAVVAAPAERMPLFVRAGSVVPMGPVTQYVDEDRAAPLTVAVYPGANAAFSLYEDDGTSEQYRKGAFTRILISYDDRTGAVTIGDRQGEGWKGMPPTRTVRVKWVRPGRPLTDDNGFDAEVTYSGRAVTVRP